MPKVTLSGLIERRAAMAAEIEQARDAVAVLTAALRHLDRMIERQGSNRDPATIGPRHLVVPWEGRQRGAVIRPVLTILRTAERPMTLREITLGVIQSRGLDAADTRVLRNVSQQVKMALANQRRQGVVAHACPRGRPVVWRIEDILPS